MSECTECHEPLDSYGPDWCRSHMDQQAQPDILTTAAVGYGQQGLRVHPCHPETQRPLTKWSEAASTHRAIIESFWQRWPDALIGLCTGDGLVVVDDDRGREEPEEDMAVTRTAKTRSRGWHHYFRTDADIGNRVGIIPGVDVRGAGGYVIAPPSPGWEWHNIAEVQPAPAWLITLMTARDERGRAWGSGFRPSPTMVSEGGRNDYLARFTGYALRLGYEGGELTHLVLDENQRICDPPCPVAEVVATVRSISRIHQRSAA